MNKDRSKIRNVGPVSDLWLSEIGIRTIDDLERIGSVEAYRLIREIRPGASIILLYALEAALWDLHWNDLPPELKDRLHEQVGYRPITRRRPVRGSAYED